MLSLWYYQVETNFGIYHTRLMPGHMDMIQYLHKARKTGIPISDLKFRVKTIEPKLVGLPEILADVK